MNRITPQDIQKGVESVSASPESTWYKVVETLDNGDKLCLAIGMGEGFDEDTVCAKLGVLAGNSAMSDYVWDFVMPWNLGEGGNDVWDTEVSNPGESDAEWFNTQAEEMIRGFEDGTIGTSLVGSSRKAGKKKPVQSMARGYLQPQYDSRASFYNKAEFDDDKLYSYGTLVAEIVDGKPVLYPDWDYSQTTIRHVREFLRQHGFTADSKAQIAKDYLTNSRKPIKNNFVEKHGIYHNDTWKLEVVELEGNTAILKPVKSDDYFVVKNPEIDEQGDLVWTSDSLPMTDYDTALKEFNYHKDLNNASPTFNSRRPIQSMYVTEDISGNDLYTRLWSGGKDQFDSMIEDGADADDILNACEELLFREEGNPPTMTELNDLIWFDPDLIRNYIGLSNPIESGCHGKSKKGKGKKKGVKSSMAGREKGIQAIMDEYGCTREEAIEIMNEEIQNSRKPVKSSFAGFDDFNSFASYAEAHYLPILDKVSEEGYQITRDDARLLAFLHDDLVSLVNNGFDL